MNRQALEAAARSARFQIEYAADIEWDDDMRAVVESIIIDNVGSKLLPVDDALSKVEHLLAIQGDDGNWNFSPYMHGMFNGMELVASIMRGDEKSNYRDAPERWRDPGQR